MAPEQASILIPDIICDTECVDGVRQVEQDHAVAFIGSKHTCVFDDFKVEFEPMRADTGMDLAAAVCQNGFLPYRRPPCQDCCPT